MKRLLVIIVAVIAIIVIMNPKLLGVVQSVSQYSADFPRIATGLVSAMSMLGISQFTGDDKPKARRNVSESTKKRVAARQNWKCGQCGKTLDETYEVDHENQQPHRQSRKQDGIGCSPNVSGGSAGRMYSRSREIHQRGRF